MENKKVWVVRGDGSKKHEKICIEDENLSIIGWQETGDLKDKKDKSKIAEVVEKTRFKKTHSKKAKEGIIGQLHNFRSNIKPGHIIVLPLKTQPGKIAAGRATGNYKFRKVEEKDKEGRHTQAVEKWEIVDKINAKHIQNVQSALHGRYCINIGQDILKLLSVQQTVSQLDRDGICYKLVERFEKIMKEGVDPELTKTHEDSKIDIEIKISPTQFEELVAYILDEERYTTCLTPVSGDGGVDVMAMKDNETTFVQVKMKKDEIDLKKEAPNLQKVMKSFSVNYGILVNWGGFDEKIKQEVQQSQSKITLWDKKEFMDLFKKHYKKLPEEIRNKIPRPK